MIVSHSHVSPCLSLSLCGIYLVVTAKMTVLATAIPVIQALSLLVSLTSSQLSGIPAFLREAGSPLS